jgi:hypothetical protein
MRQRYIVTYEYSESIKGERRDFVHETMFEASDLLSANRAAKNHFEELARESWVGWRRTLHRFEVKAAPLGAVARGGRRIYPERSLEE